jgi:hypothetical protein
MEYKSINIKDKLVSIDYKSIEIQLKVVCFNGNDNLSMNEMRNATFKGLLKKYGL